MVVVLESELRKQGRNKTHCKQVGGKPIKTKKGKERKFKMYHSQLGCLWLLMSLFCLKK